VDIIGQMLQAAPMELVEIRYDVTKRQIAPTELNTNVYKTEYKTKASSIGAACFS
jgi:hypothetical protein